MRLAVFGGTFDPVHRGHLAVAGAAAKRFGLELIHFVPASRPPHKGSRVLTDFHHRFAMLALATAADDRFIPSLMESDATQPNYSIHTVRRLKSGLKKPDNLYFLVGIDAFMEIGTWKQAAELLGECDFIVVSRPGYSLADVGDALPEELRPPATVLRALQKKQAGRTIKLPSTTIHLLNGVEEQVSSTQIRSAAQKSAKQLSRYVPEEVVRYIKKERLYTSAPTQPEKESAQDGKVLSFRRAHQQEL